MLEILRIGGPAYARIGTEASTGPRLFCLSGCVQRPGVYEVPFGATLRQMLEMAGGVPPGRTLQAILLGRRGGCLRAARRARHAAHLRGRPRGPGDAGLGRHHGVRRYASTWSTILRRIAAFFRDESCGQCVPCRVGTVRQEEALHRILARQDPRRHDGEVALLEEIGLAMKDASICGLGQTAYSAVESAIKRLHLFNGAAAQ